MIAGALFLSLQPPPGLPENCHRCKDTGYQLCRKHPKNILEIEGQAIHCSHITACKVCGGTLKVPCKFCTKDVTEDIEKEKATHLAWLEKMKEIDTFMKSKKIMHCESPHFILTFNLPRLSVGKRAYTTHTGMHLYLERLEALFVDVCKDLGATEKDFLAKTHVMIWEREHEIVRTAAKYCHQSSNTKSYLLGKAPIFTIFYNKGFLHEEFELHQAVVHNVVHCLLSNVWDGIWPGNIKGGWIDAGYAHHYELIYFKHKYGGGVRNYCYREGDMAARFKYGKWHASVRQAVDKGETPSFLLVAAKNVDLLEPLDHMFSWSYVDFILKEYPEQFGPVARKIKQRLPIAQVFRETLKMTPFQFEEKWKVYVQENYSLKDTPTGTQGRRKR